MAAIVETRALAETVIAATIAGIGITTVFSVAIWSAARFAELSRSERPLAAGAAAVLGLLAFGATLGAVAVGIIVMTSK